uniref:Uncharacterized protein n=1 Tax=Timema shepardi TaxID=629360 RepID=A0A7R9G2C1_TIMSH|nr:unnamed protein product [Timema shepardi]
MASLVLTDSSQLTSDSQHLGLKTDSMFSDFATKCLQALWLPISNADSERYFSRYSPAFLAGVTSWLGGSRDPVLAEARESCSGRTRWCHTRTV